MLDRRHSAQWDEFIVRAANIDVFQLLRVQTIDALDLGNDLVTASGNVETIDIISADGRGEIGSHLLHVQAERSHFVVIENNLRLRLIDLCVDVRESK